MPSCSRPQRFLVVCGVYFAVTALTELPLSSSLRISPNLCNNNSHHHHPYRRVRHNRYSYYYHSGFELEESNKRIGCHPPQQQGYSRRITHLTSRKNPEDNNDEKKTISSFLLPDRGVYVADGLALVLASQLIGLLNIINNPEWIRKGGWFQPIGVPKTLDELVIRISFFAVVWAISSVLVVVTTTTVSTNTNDPNKNDDTSSTTTTTLLKNNLQTLVVFGLLQLLGYGTVGSLTTTDSGIPWLEILRNSYYVGLSTLGLRFLYGQYFLWSSE